MHQTYACDQRGNVEVSASNKKPLDEPRDLGRKENQKGWSWSRPKTPSAADCLKRRGGNRSYSDSTAERKAHLTCTLHVRSCRLKIFSLLLFFLKEKKKTFWDLMDGPLKTSHHAAVCVFVLDFFHTDKAEQPPGTEAGMS